LPVQAATISGNVKDSSGAAAGKARVEISGGALTAAVSLETDAQGHFFSPDLKPGSYTLKVTANGFEPSILTVELTDAGKDLSIALQVAALRQEVTVEGKVSSLANSDPLYRQFRDAEPGVTYHVRDFTLRDDVGTFVFTEGTLTFLKPIGKMVTGAIFVGQGHFNLKAVQVMDRRELARRAHAEQVDEDFTSVVFRYTGNYNQVFLQGLKEPTEQPKAASIFSQWKEQIRTRHIEARSFTESLLNGGEMDNTDADLLAWLYNPVNEHSLLQAYIRGTKHKDLRFFARARGGAISGLGSPEEVGLINDDPEGLDDGIWYLSHKQAEFAAGTANSLEERRFVAARKFTIETVIGGNDHLTSIATVTFQPLLAGERVIRFQLLPNLRVSRVTSAGKEIAYIQESRKADGSFYVILPEGVEVAKDYSITIEYSGDKVIMKAGSGSFYIGAREAWYPNLNDFQERAVYDLTFRVPKRFHLISVGKLESETTEEGQNVTHWVTPIPVAVAGFNYGDYKKIEFRDEKVGTTVSGYYLTELPDSLSHYPALASMAPKSMTSYALDQTRAQLEVCTLFFGKSPFDTISITEQPNFSFGQSWPNLVYLPISAYIDSTQRWELFGSINNRFTAFVDEVTPHEVAHQWWGHAVGWATYHDQWLSEGFAEFSAGLFLQQATGPKWQSDYIQFWERLKKRILEKNQFGAAPNDAGPLWLGLRLMSPRSESAYQNVTYPKGAYVLAMLRSLMYTNKDHDQAFMAMMHDFVATYSNRPASTEAFKAIAEKHMSHAYDFENNGRLDWFFREWVYGTEVPRYQFEYEVTPAADGKTKLHLTLTQSEVSEQFAMSVPIFADFGKGFIRLGQLPAIGNSTKTYDFELPVAPKKVALNAYKEILER
jgi:hypothetical protein